MKKESVLVNYGLIVAVITHGLNGSLLSLSLALFNRVATFTN